MGRRVRAAINALKVQAEAAGASDETIDMYNSHVTNYAHTEAKAGKTFIGKTKNSILNPKISSKYVGDSARAGLKGNTADKRANLRAQHERVFKPFGDTAQKITTSDRMVRSGDPNVVAGGRVLRADADKASLKSGKQGIAVAAVVVAGYALGASSASFSLPKASTMGKFIGTQGIAAMNDKNKKKEAATGGLADTSDGNGDGMDPITSRRYQDYMSDAAGKFFNTGGAAAAGGGASSCGMTGGGEPWLFVLGVSLFVVGLVWRAYGNRH